MEIGARGLQVQEEGPVEPAENRPSAPAVMLDAGDERGDVLLSAIERYVEDLGPGQVLLVVCQHREAVSDVPLWCSRAGHELISRQSCDSEHQFWIKRSDQ